MTNHSFTQMQCLHAIANWDKEPFTPLQLSSLLLHFTADGRSNDSYEYGESDIQSFILHTLSELQDNTEQFNFTQDIISFITKHPYYHNNDGNHTEDEQNDANTFDISDPNGDYERLIITIQGIA